MCVSWFLVMSNSASSHMMGTWLIHFLHCSKLYSPHTCENHRILQYRNVASLSTSLLCTRPQIRVYENSCAAAVECTRILATNPTKACLTVFRTGKIAKCILQNNSFYLLFLIVFNQFINSLFDC